MFENIGAKLKGLAYFLCVGGIAGSVIGGISLMSNDLVLFGLLTAVVGSLGSWISSWVVYAIGEIAENTQKNRGSYGLTGARSYNIDEEAAKKRIQSVFKATHTNSSSNPKRCPYCGEVVKSSACEMCGKKNNLFK